MKKKNISIKQQLNYNIDQTYNCNFKCKEHALF